MTNVEHPAYPQGMTSAERDAALLRVRHAADAAYSDGISEEEILRAVGSGIEHAKYVSDLFAEPITNNHKLRKVT